MKRAIPNLITLLNLSSGATAAFLCLTNQKYIHIAALLIILAAIFDFFDGFTARILNTNSELGKNLDSLADIISFGTAPAAIAFQLIAEQTTSKLLPFIAIIIIPFSAIRLAMFNIDPNQKSEFRGLPTPALALFFVGIASKAPNNHIFSNIFFLIISIFTLSILLITKIPMFSLKFKNFKFKNNKLRYIFLLLSLIILIFFNLIGFTYIIILYILLSIIYASKTFLNKNNK